MRSPRLMWLGVGVAVLVAFAGPGGAAAAGPWRATIVDAETGKPLEGVVVVAAFAKYTKGLAGLAGAEYYGSNEAVTGPDGRFEIPARNLWTPIRVFTVVRVEFTIAKPAYGHARWRVTAEQEERWRDLTLAELLEQPDITMEMPVLKTREARWKYLTNWMVHSVVPLEAIPRFIEAENTERAYLGLSPLR